MKQIKKTSLIASLYALMLMGILAGCEKDVYNPDSGKKELPPMENFPDFKLTGDVQLSVNYGISGAVTLIEVYDENPMLNYKTKKEGVSPKFMAFTNVNGQFEGVMNIPTAMKKAYLYTHMYGLPMCVEMDVDATGFSYDATKQISDTRAGGVLSDKVPFELSGNADAKRLDNMYSLTTFNYNGTPNLSGYLSVPATFGSSNEPILTISNRVSDYLYKRLAEVKDANKGLLRDPEVLNLKVPATATNGMKVSVTFMGEHAGYFNTFGYYYYGPGESMDATKLFSTKKYVVFPNATNNGGSESYLQVGATAKLLYFDANGASHEEFPAGYTIGWFLICNGFGTFDPNPNGSPGSTLGYVKKTAEMAWEYGYGNGRIICSSNDTGDLRRFITVYDEKSKTRIVGIEDNVSSKTTPDDYMDLMFAVQTSIDLESGGIEPIPPVDPEPEPGVLTPSGTVAFEDIWPEGGDYDLNDVIVEYDRQITFNKDNKATKVVETFMPVQPSGSALQDNFFACEFAKPGKVSVPSGVLFESNTNSIVIEASARTIKGNTYVIERNVEGLGLSQNDVLNDFNPYIITKAYTKENRIEVHLPKGKMTSAADESKMDAGNAYYIGKKEGLFYPFAINIPITDFVPATEKVAIDAEYPDFAGWAKDNNTNVDWYTKKN